ncbi:MAG: hypothetical protein HYW48_10495 [Deltaproteobacteria bacterium]|nr:hypothetical protein [Deltaproteobacteria bacterium]
MKRLQNIRKDLLSARYQMCTQKAFLMSEFMKGQNLFKESRFAKIVAHFHYYFYRKNLRALSDGVKIPDWKVKVNRFLSSFYKTSEVESSKQLRFWAETLQYILSNMKLQVYDHELIVGNPSSHRIGAPIHPDYSGMLMLRELDTIATRKINPLQITREEILKLKKEVFPIWFRRSVLFHSSLRSLQPSILNRMLSDGYFLLTQVAGISHLTPNYSLVLKRGFLGIKEDIQKQQKTIGGSEKGDFYSATLIVIDAAIAYSERWCHFLAQQAVQTPDLRRKQELTNLAELFKRVPANPATTFHEALQSVFITHVILHQESFQHGISFGRIDQFLLPYYQKDREEGTLTLRQAVELIGCFLAKAGELLPLFPDTITEYFSGLSSASGITLGGKRSLLVPPDAISDGVNDLSYLFLVAYDQLRLRQPNIHVRVHRDSPKKFMRLCYRVLKKGGGMPAFFNDEQIIPILENQGFAPDDARNYSIVGCTEWGVPNKSFPAAGAGFINLAFALQLALNNGYYRNHRFGAKTGDPNSWNTLEEVITAFSKQLRFLAELAVQENNVIEDVHAKFRPTPFLSVLVEGCIENGREVTTGGACYNSTGLQGVGVADVIDSLIAIDQVVFQQKQMSLGVFIDKVRDNFVNDKSLHAYLLNKIPKFGNDDSKVNQCAQKITSIFTEIVCSMQNRRGGRYFPGFWSMTTHQGFGKLTDALPSGRKKGESLANGMSPYSGWDRKGPTATLNSAANIDGGKTANGAVLNLTVAANHMGTHSRFEQIDGLLNGYFTKGGLQLQFNVLDRQLLLQAKKEPEKFRDLVVRISGYSAYFIDLTEDMQDELIARTSF